MSRSKLKIMEFSLVFRVTSISPLFLEGLSLNIGQMFRLARLCAEFIIQPCRLTVNSTVEDQKCEAFDFASASYLRTPH